MEHSLLEFFKTVKKMRDSGSTCSEVLRIINLQPNEIKALFERKHLIALQKCGDKVLKGQSMNRGSIGSGLGDRAHDNAAKTWKSFRLTDYDYFDIFIKDKIKELEKEESRKKK